MRVTMEGNKKKGPCHANKSASECMENEEMKLTKKRCMYHLSNQVIKKYLPKEESAKNKEKRA